jgi:adenylate cyclase class 2
MGRGHNPWREPGDSTGTSYGRAATSYHLYKRDLKPVTETEIKLRWPGDADSARAHIEARGYTAAPRLLEADQLFDLASEELRSNRQVLRLRISDGKATITYKGPPASGPYKSREEIEFDVDNPHAFETVLSRLGYQRAFRYEKFRTKFRADEGIIALDETPMGIFIELEGPEYWIDATAERLGFTREQFSTSSYAALYGEFREAHADAPVDMVFVGGSLGKP